MVAIVSLFVAHLLADTFTWPHQTEAVFGILALGLLVYCTFQRPIENVMADSAPRSSRLLYVGFTLLALPTLHEEANGPSLVTFLLCVVWAGRHCGALCWPHLWPAQAGADAEPEQDMGGRHWLAGRAACWWRAGCWGWRTAGAVELGPALLSRGRLVLAGAGRGGERGGAGGRSGRVRA